MVLDQKLQGSKFDQFIYFQKFQNEPKTDFLWITPIFSIKLGNIQIRKLFTIPSSTTLVYELLTNPF
jgi:hypothetical protein